MHTGKTSSKILIIAAAACLPFAASAGDGKDTTGAHGGASFETLDANRDGRISQAEAAVDASIMFTSADQNRDGYLDKAEWQGREKKHKDSAPRPQSMSDSSAEAPSSTEPLPDTETPRQ